MGVLAFKRVNSLLFKIWRKVNSGWFFHMQGAVSEAHRTAFGRGAVFS